MCLLSFLFTLWPYSEHAQEGTAEASLLRDTCPVNCFHKGMCKGSLKKIPLLPEDTALEISKVLQPNLCTSEDCL